ncbi:MAG: hypothetical protein ACOCWQ_03925 [Nanoarchaeota archaeon]
MIRGDQKMVIDAYMTNEASRQQTEAAEPGIVRRMYDAARSYGLRTVASALIPLAAMSAGCSSTSEGGAVLNNRGWEIRFGGARQDQLYRKGEHPQPTGRIFDPEREDYSSALRGSQQSTTGQRNTEKDPMYGPQR